MTPPVPDSLERPDVENALSEIHEFVDAPTFQAGQSSGDPTSPPSSATLEVGSPQEFRDGWPEDAELLGQIIEAATVLRERRLKSSTAPGALPGDRTPDPGGAATGDTGTPPLEVAAPFPTVPVDLPQVLEHWVVAAVAEGRAASFNEAVAKAVMAWVFQPKPKPTPSAEPDMRLVNFFSENGELMDQIVKQAMIDRERRWSRPADE